MKYAALVTLASSIVAASAWAALNKGDAAPPFTAQASLAGKEFTFSLKDALKKGPVVVYFYPSAYTQGCNIQAHEFAENYDKFSAAGATVVGVSLDDISRLNEFSKDPKYCASRLPVASDAKGQIAKSYDLKIIDEFNGQKAATFKDSRGIEIGHSFTERTTFIVMPDGKIAETIGGVSPAENVSKALESVQHLNMKTG
jgi:thioredoxin-dependent peroxiredoxin